MGVTPTRFALREIAHRPGHAALFVLSVALGAGTWGGLHFFADAVQRAVTGQAQALWAADVTVDGTPAFLDTLQKTVASEFSGLTFAQSVDALSMVQTVGAEKTSAVTLSGVSERYPLYGALTTGSGAPFQEAVRSGLVVAPKLLTLLNARVGDRLQIGRSSFVIVDTLASRTEAPASFFELSPAVFLTTDALEKTGLLGPGSRSLSRLYIRSPDTPPALLGRLRLLAATESAEVKTWRSDNPGVLRFVNTTLKHLNFLSLLVLILGGLGVASALRAALASSWGSMGAAMALGSPRSYLIRLWLTWMGLLGLGGLGIGLFLARLVGPVVARLYGDMIPVQIIWGWSGEVLASTFLMATAVPLLFALWPLRLILNLPPHHILTRQDPPQDPRGGALYILAAAPLLGGLLWLTFGDIKTAVWVLAALAGLLIAGTLLVWITERFVQFCPFRGPLIHAAQRALGRPGSFHTATAVSLALSLGVLVSHTLIEKNMTKQFVTSFPENMPNVFFINIQPTQRETFRQIVTEPMALHPLVRGRLLSINSVPVRERRFKNAASEGDSLTREFGLTFGESLLPTDRVVDGPGLWEKTPGPQVSVYDRFKKRFGLGRGDQLVFRVLGRDVAATVSSFRSIDQSVRQPFFYFYFQPGTLDTFPHTYMGGVHLKPAAIAPTELALAKRLPNVTTLDLSEVAALTSKILTRLTRVVQGLGLFGVGAGVLLLVSSLLTALPERRRETVLYRTLGATGPQLFRLYFWEYLLRGATASVSALFLGSVSAWGVVRWGLGLDFFMPWGDALALLLGGTLFLGLFSIVITTQAFRGAPQEVLRSE